MANFDWKALIPYAAVVLFFMAISLAFFYPQLQGKQLATHDQKQWKGGAKELNDAYTEKDEIRLWTNSMFGGMPAYYVSMHYSTNFIAKYIRPVTSLGIERPAVYIIWSLISFFILMMVLKVDIPIGVMGSIGYAFTSYNFVILSAGHFSKVLAMGYLPGILAGALLIRKGKYLAGASITALFMSFEMISNHPQMTYYYFVFFLVFYFLLDFIESIKKKETKNYMISASLFGLAVILGILPSAAQLLTTKEYTAFSTRGQSELTINKSEDRTTGLDRSYITNWSGGVAETWSLLIPHAKGPGSSTLSNYPQAMKQVDRQYKKPMEGVDAYWGDQPFVGGPMYAGAIIVFLFVVGLFLVDGILKWALVLATIITTMLSWGKNFPGLTNFFIDYFPMYNKFRAVVSIEIVSLFAIPVLAALALKKISDNPKFLEEKAILFGKELKFSNMQFVGLSFILTGGISLIFWLAPDMFFEFFKSGEYENYSNSLKQNGWPAGQITELLENMANARKALFKLDAIRTFGFILVSFGLIWGFFKGKISRNFAMYGIAALVLVDMYSVNTRYMDVKEGFEPKRKVVEPFTATQADNIIKQDNTPGYRVLNVAVSTFNGTETSYFHHSLGGYNGAKMKNYQEVIETYISAEIQSFRTGLRSAKSLADVNGILASMPIINMLNTKYIIYNPDASPVTNAYANGSAWFVKDVKWVESADEEMISIGTTDLKSTAVIRNDQKEIVSKVGDGQGSIVLAEYDMDRLVYNSNSSSDQLAVFSEIWYPVGWQITIDGKPVEMARANYLLRTMEIPAGSHEIVFEFKPKSYFMGENIAFVGSTILLLLLAGSIYQTVTSKKD